MKSLKFENSSLDHISFVLLNGTGLSFVSGSTVYCGFDEGTLKDVVFEKGKVDGQSSINQSLLQAINFSSSKIKNFSIAGCELKEYVVLNEATFENLRLENNQYDRGFEVDAENTQYINSDRFQPQ